METATAQSRKQFPDCAATIYGNGDSTVAQTVPRLCCNHLWKRQMLRWRLMGQALKNNQEPSFIRLWKWNLLRLNQSSWKPKAPITIGVALSGLKGKIASALEKNEKLAPIAIAVEFDRKLKLSAPIASKLRRNSRS
jgi:hypothetical protein